MTKSREKHNSSEETQNPPNPQAPEHTAAAPAQKQDETQKHEEREPQDAHARADEGAKLTNAIRETDDLKDQLLRLRADFDNFRKRSLREKNEIYENANEALMLDLLPVLDHMHIALEAARERQADRAFQEGMRLILDQLMGTLSKYGLTAFNTVKQPFDPKQHEAISYLPSETDPEGVVTAQSRQGYRLHNKLLRPSQVVVSSGKPAPVKSGSEANLTKE